MHFNYLDEVYQLSYQIDQSILVKLRTANSVTTNMKYCEQRNNANPSKL